jgi:hypothetical protein
MESGLEHYVCASEQQHCFYLPAKVSDSSTYGFRQYHTGLRCALSQQELLV